MKTHLDQGSHRKSAISPVKCFWALLSAALFLMVLPAPSHAALIAYDTFDSALNVSSRNITPDYSGNDGFFGDSNSRIFGITNRQAGIDRIANDLLDTSSVDPDPGSGDFNHPNDTFGILKSTKADDVFAVARELSGGNAVWNFDISGVTTNDLYVGIDFAAMADWNTDYFTFTASLDGGAAVDLFDISRAPISHTYTMEGGNTVDKNNPLTIDGEIIDNDFQRMYASISGFTDESTLTLTFTSDPIASQRLFVFDNVGVYDAVPIPGTVWLLGAGLLGFVGIRQRYQ